MKENKLKEPQDVSKKDAKNFSTLVLHPKSEHTLVMRKVLESLSTSTMSMISMRANAKRMSRNKEKDAILEIMNNAEVDMKERLMTDTNVEAQTGPIGVDEDTEAELLKLRPIKILILNLKNHSNPSNKKKVRNSQPLPTNSKSQVLKPIIFKSMPKK